MIDTALNNFGKVDILILNAGVSAHLRFDEI
jgi:NADP-dependent 3-hydroxy acid dehydrogenase YdfG